MFEPAITTITFRGFNPQNCRRVPFLASLGVPFRMPMIEWYIWSQLDTLSHDGSMVLLYMVTFTISIPPMLAYIPYMDPMGLISVNSRYPYWNALDLWIWTKLTLALGHIAGDEIEAKWQSNLSDLEMANTSIFESRCCMCFFLR